ncbi:ATP-grasp domain-containing protein [Streptomyces sp. URMC 129]|uniref:ATP-grasp domain-containing protein n=1 Tax=Streptomyces sp. URMC 129 TaxID=3423407 RepID=UPI003F1D8C95
MNPPRVAIVDGYSTTTFLLAALRERGVQCVHVRSQSDTPEFLARSFEPDAYLADLGHQGDIEHLVDELRAIGVARVVPGLERGVILAYELNHRLGLPSNELPMARAWRDKYIMAAALQAKGLDAPRSALVDDSTDSVAWFDAQGGRPVVVKPTASAGTDGVRICRTADDVIEASIAILSRPNIYGQKNASVLVQERLDGVEHIVNTVSVDGVHKISDVWVSNKRVEATGLPFYDYQDAVPVDDALATVVHYVKDALTALGIRNGAAHTELMVTDRGPVLIETGARLMGSSMPNLTYRCTGVSHVHLLCTALCDPAGFDRYDETEVVHSERMRYVWLSNQLACARGAGAWRDEFAALPTFAALSTFAISPDTVPQTVDTITSPGLVALIGDNAADLDRDHRAIRALEADNLYAR